MQRESIIDLGGFFTWYAERYMASDVDSISEVYEAPLLALRDGHVIHLADRDAVRGHLGELMAAYAQSGAARADVVALDVVGLGKSSAFATVHWHVRDPEGAVLKDFRTTYHLLQDAESWRILSYTNHDE